MGHEFKVLCDLAYEVPNFVVGEVKVQEDEDDGNDDLRKRYGLNIDDFPAYLLFKDAGSPARFRGNESTADLSTWLRGHGVKIQAVGTIAELDAIAARLVANGALTDADV